MEYTSTHTFVAILALMLTDTINSARVCFLCCCKPTVSSHVYMRNVAKSLYDRGHNVSLVLPEHLSNDKDIYAFPGADIIWYDTYTKETYELQRDIMDLVVKYGTMNISTMTKLGEAWRDTAESILRDKSLLEKMKKRNFDLFALDYLPRQLSIFPYRLSLPFVYISPIYEPWKFGIPSLPSFVPHQVTPYSDQMTFSQRLLNTLITMASDIFDPWGDENAVKRIAPNVPYIRLSELNRKAELFIVQASSILDYPRPTMPNVKLIAGLTANMPNQLPLRQNSFIEASKDGVIFVSLGTGDIKLRDNISDMFLQIFSELNYGVIWRTRLALNKSNILQVSWVNQNDVLGNNKVKAYISHCGLNGQYEALYHAVPTLCIPFYGDQFYFAECITRKGFGKALDWKNLVQSEVKKVIIELLNNSSMKENTKRASDVMRSTGQLPRDEAAYWIDHVIKYGGSYMRSQSQIMTWYEYLLLDVACVCVISVLILIFLCWIIIKWIFAKKEETRKIKNE